MVKIDWKPIESAPKDGTEFTAGWNNHNHWASGTPMCWQTGRTRNGWFLLSPHYETDQGKVSMGKWLNERDYPTHWSPLIVPPEKEKPIVFIYERKLQLTP